MVRDFVGDGLWDKVRNNHSRRGGSGVKWNRGRTSKRSHLRPDPTGGSANERLEFGEGNHPEKARRRISDVVNRSEAEIDTPEECPQGKAKPQSNGHGSRSRASPPALTMTRRRRLVRSPKRFEPPNSLKIGMQREGTNTVNLSVSENRIKRNKRLPNLLSRGCDKIWIHRTLKIEDSCIQFLARLPGTNSSPQNLRLWLENGQTTTPPPDAR